MPATIEISYFPINIYLINAQIKGKFPQDRDFQTGALPTGFFPSLSFVHPPPVPWTLIKVSRSQLILVLVLVKHNRRIDYSFCPNHPDWRHKERAGFSLTDLAFAVVTNGVYSPHSRGSPLPGLYYLRDLHLPSHP